MPTKIEVFEESFDQHRGLLEDIDTEEQSYRHKDKTVRHKDRAGITHVILLIVYVILFIAYSFGLYYLATKRALATDLETDISIPGALELIFTISITSNNLQHHLRKPFSTSSFL